MDAVDFDWWRAALEGRIAPIDVNEPASGYYKLRRRNRQTNEVTFSTVAYWRDDFGLLQCRIDGEQIGTDRAVDVWPYCSKCPISYETYGAVRRGEPWPGENAAVSGHNKSPVGDTLMEIADRVDDLGREAERLIAAGAAQSDDIADQASDVANTLAELEKKADKARADEKEPHLSAGRAVDAKWKPIVDRAADLKRRLKSLVVTPFLTAKQRAAEDAARAAIVAGTPPEELPQVRTTAGSSKRSTALRTYVSADVDDWPALLAALHEHPKIREAAQAIADASAKAGVALPGTKISKSQRAA